MEFQPAAFDFSLCKRNLALQESGMAPIKAKSTGTTIVAATYESGIVLGGDSRATAGSIVADKFCMKVHKLTNSIYARGAGTAADLDKVCGVDPTGTYLYDISANGTTMAKSFAVQGSGSYRPTA